MNRIPASMRTAWRAASCGLVLTALLASPARGADPVDTDSPIGRWQTYDDKTQAPKGMVRIYEKDGKLFGRIERPAARKNDGDVCTVCTDERKGQPIDGLVIVRNMERSSADPLEWSGGDVLDPDTGKLYRFKMRVEEHGTRLACRGFIGFSLLGRTQTWSRLP